MAQKDVCRTKKRRKSIVFLGISIVICWIIFAKKSEKSDELIHSIPLSKSTTVPINLNRKSKKKERAKISKTGAWIISDNYEYLLDENLARQLVNLFRNSTVIEFGAGTGRRGRGGVRYLWAVGAAIQSAAI